MCKLCFTLSEMFFLFVNMMITFPKIPLSYLDGLNVQNVNSKRYTGRDLRQTFHQYLYK